MIFPGSATQGRPEAALPAEPAREQLRLPTPGGIRIAAELARLPDSNLRPSAIYFYGNGGCLGRSEMEFWRLHELGANALIPDYPGYGLSEGRPSEAGCYAAGEAACDHLRSRPDIDPGRIVAVGRSLGAAVALDLGSRRPLAGIVLISPFTDMAEMARLVAPWQPLRLLLRQRFDNLSKIARVRCPILILHGTQDALVPLKMAERLAAAAPERTRLVRLEGVGHPDVFERAGEEVWAEIGRFLGSV